MNRAVALVRSKEDASGEWVDANGIHYEDLESLIKTCLGLCGCADIGILALARQVLSGLSEKQKNLADGGGHGLPDGPLGEAFLHMLEHNGLLEHGTSIRSPWPTEEGKCVLKWLERWHAENAESCGETTT